MQKFRQLLKQVWCVGLPSPLLKSLPESLFVSEQAAIAHFPLLAPLSLFMAPVSHQRPLPAFPRPGPRRDAKPHKREKRDLSDLPDKISPPRPRMKKKKRRRRRENENYLRPSRSSSSQKKGGGGLLPRIKKCNEDLFTIGSITHTQGLLCIYARAPLIESSFRGGSCMALTNDLAINISSSQTLFHPACGVRIITRGREREFTNRDCSLATVYCTVQRFFSLLIPAGRKGGS